MNDAVLAAGLILLATDLLGDIVVFVAMALLLVVFFGGLLYRK